MKNKLLFLILVIGLMMAFCLTANAMTGSGTESDPYIVETEDDFVSIQSKLSAHYKLNSDLEFTSTTGAIVEGTFTGVFDGNGHTVDLSISVESSSTNTFDALFGVSTGTIKNLVITGSVSGSDKVAGVVGKIEGGLVDNCVNYATITGKKNVGGVVGLIYKGGAVTNCINFGEINGHKPISKGLDMGGVVGCVWDVSHSSLVVSSCLNFGPVYGQGFNAGGVVGHINSGKYESLFNFGTVEITASSDHIGGIFGEIGNSNSTYYLDGYYSATSDTLAGYLNGKTLVPTNPMLVSSGVAIYLGTGSGIRGEFHLNESVFEEFCELAAPYYDIEYGALVSTKDVLESFGEEIVWTNNDGIVFAPAMKNGKKIYGYADESKGDSYHSYRFALTGFDENKETYNIEFVILGYISIENKNGLEVFPINTVKSDRLAAAVGETGFNAVSIVRVAEVTLEDGDFEGNETATNKLNEIIANKDYSVKIEIDGIVGYGHKKAMFTKHISSGDTVVFNITSTDEDELSAYLEDLALAGYQKIFENAIEGIKFYTYKNSEKLIHITYNASTNNVKISYETAGDLPSFTPSSYETVTTPSVTQLTQQASIQEGMSYVIQLSDGSFFIVDGGWCDDNKNEAIRLYNKLTQLAGEGNDIVIAGWIFTHCHGDHIGTFNLFVESYHENVTIKEIIYNFPSDSDIAAGASYMLDNSNQRYNKFKSVISTYLTDTKIIKAHSGYKFYYADLEVEILQTFEDLYPSAVSSYDFNSTSTIFKLNIAGQSMLFLGDVDDTGANKLTSIYSTALKSDFVQIAHHGLNRNDAIKNIYISAESEYVFFPTSESWYNQHKDINANFYLLTESRTVKQVFASFKGTMTLALPYDGTQYNGDKFPGFESIIPDDSDRVEAQRPTGTIEVPDAYFDLDLSGSAPTDSKGNATVTVKGGEINETTVYHSGEATTTNAFSGDKTKENYYLTLNFNNIKSDSQMADFVMSSSTFEIFLQLESLPKNTVGLITSCNGGGFTLYLRREAGQINFQIGSTYSNSNSDGGLGGGMYSAASPMNDYTMPLAEAGTLLHIVGSYDSKTKMMKLYINGILVASADYGTGSFRDGNGNDFVVGIGYNPQYPNEEISKFANYELYEAKIYNTALTDEQVVQEYWNCIDNLFKEEAGK